MRFIAGLAVVTCLIAGHAQAELATVRSSDEFVRIVGGKTLTRPFVKLRVTSDGKIEGRGARWDVTGKWTWRDGFFCRNLVWGGDELGYNCQQVKANSNGTKIRFRSDRGSGDYADFRLK